MTWIDRLNRLDEAVMGRKRTSPNGPWPATWDRDPPGRLYGWALEHPSTALALFLLIHALLGWLLVAAGIAWWVMVGVIGGVLLGSLPVAILAWRGDVDEYRAWKS